MLIPEVLAWSAISVLTIVMFPLPASGSLAVDISSRYGIVELLQLQPSDIADEYTTVWLNRSTDYEAYRAQLQAWLERDDIDLEFRSLLMAHLAHDLQRSNEHPQAVQVLEELIELQTENPDREVSFIAAVEVASIMAASAGHSKIPNFDLSFQEIEAAFNRVFENYDPYRREVFDAYLSLITRGYNHFVSYDDVYAGYAARRYLAELEQLVKDLEEDPSLAAKSFGLQKYHSQIKKQTGHHRTISCQVRSRAESRTETGRRLDGPGPSRVGRRD